MKTKHHNFFNSHIHHHNSIKAITIVVIKALSKQYCNTNIGMSKKCVKIILYMCNAMWIFIKNENMKHFLYTKISLTKTQWCIFKTFFNYFNIWSTIATDRSLQYNALKHTVF